MGKPPHAHDATVGYSTYKTYMAQNLGFVSNLGRGLPPLLMRHKTTVVCCKQKLWTQIDHLLLDLDTCLTPEAKNWTDVNC